MSFRWISILILFMSGAIKLWLSCFNKKLGKRINSKVMLATSADALGDVVTTSGYHMLHRNIGAFGFNVDGIVGLIVSVVVMIAGVNIAKDTLAPLIGGLTLRFMTKYQALWRALTELWAVMI